MRLHVHAAGSACGDAGVLNRADPPLALPLDQHPGAVAGKATRSISYQVRMPSAWLAKRSWWKAWISALSLAPGG